MDKKEKNKKNEFAYFIEDKSFGKLYVKKSANAWWMDRGKVERLIMGYKMDCKPQECRLLAGISKDQLDYFEKMHPEFSAILDDMRKLPSIKARQTIIRSLENDPKVAMWYLERKEADEFKEKKEIESQNLPILIDDMFSPNCEECKRSKETVTSPKDPNSANNEARKNEIKPEDQMVEFIDDDLDAKDSTNNTNNKESEEADWMTM